MLLIYLSQVIRQVKGRNGHPEEERRCRSREAHVDGYWGYKNLWKLREYSKYSSSEYNSPVGFRGHWTYIYIHCILTPCFRDLINLNSATLTTLPGDVRYITRAADHFHVEYDHLQTLVLLRYAGIPPTTKGSLSSCGESCHHRHPWRV